MPSMPKSQRLRGRGLGSDHKRGRLDLLMELTVANSSGVGKPASLAWYVMINRVRNRTIEGYTQGRSKMFCFGTSVN